MPFGPVRCAAPQLLFTDILVLTKRVGLQLRIQGRYCNIYYIN